MTPKIIYYDFQNSHNQNNLKLEPASAVVLTDSLLSKYRNFRKALKRIDSGINGTCFALNITCICVSLFMIGYVLLAS